jgi:hypothetical protein
VLNMPSAAAGGAAEAEEEEEEGLHKPRLLALPLRLQVSRRQPQGSPVQQANGRQPQGSPVQQANRRQSQVLPVETVVVVHRQRVAAIAAAAVKGHAAQRPMLRLRQTHLQKPLLQDSRVKPKMTVLSPDLWEAVAEASRP